MYLLAILLCWTAAVIGYRLEDPAIWVAYGFINPIIFFLPRAAYCFVEAVRKRVSPKWLWNIERLGVGVLLLNIPGSIYLHGLGIQYDRFLHFGAAFLFFFITMLALTLVQRFRRMTKKKRLGVTFLVTFVGLFAWEGIQFTSDRLFGTHLFFDAVQPIALDVSEDIIFGLVGILVATLLLRYSRSMWSTLVEKSEKIEKQRVG